MPRIDISASVSGMELNHSIRDDPQARTAERSQAVSHSVILEYIEWTWISRRAATTPLNSSWRVTVGIMPPCGPWHVNTHSIEFKLQDTQSDDTTRLDDTY
jgi:hypothetical protein